jgi:hypothetical protein
MQDESHPDEVRSLSRALHRWRDHFVAWHDAFVTNLPTEAINNLVKRIERIGFRFRKFGALQEPRPALRRQPNWHLLPTIASLRSEEPELPATP